MHGRSAIIGILILFACGLVQAQEQPTFFLTRLDANNGLQHDERNVFVSRDAQGFTWIGSSAGPYQHDGEVLRLPPFQTGQAPVGVTSRFFEYPQGVVWFSHRNGLARYRYEDDQIETFDLAYESTAPLGLQLFALDTLSESLWLANGAELLAASATDPTSPQVRVASQSVRHLTVEAGPTRTVALGFPWLLAKGVEILSLPSDTTTNVDVRQTKDTCIQQLTLSGGTVDEAGQIWLCGDGGLHLYNLEADSLIGSYPPPGSTGKTVRTVTRYGNRLIAACEQGGLHWFDPTTRRYCGPVRSSNAGTDTLTQLPLTVTGTPNTSLLVSRSQGGLDLLTPHLPGVARLQDRSGSPVAARGAAVGTSGTVYISTADGRILEYKAGTIRCTQATVLDRANYPYRGSNLAANHAGNLFYAAGKAVWHKSEASATPWQPCATLPGLIRSLHATPTGLLTHLGQRTVHLTSQGHQTPVRVQSSYLRLNRASDLYALGKQHYLLDNLDGNWRLLRFQDNSFVVVDSLAASGEILACALATTRDTLWTGHLTGLETYVRRTAGNWEKVQHSLRGSRVLSLRVSPKGQVVALTDAGLSFRRGATWYRLGVKQGFPKGSNRYDVLLTSGANDCQVWAGFRESLTQLDLCQAAASLQHDSAAVYLKEIRVNAEPLTLSYGARQASVRFAGRTDRLEFDLGVLTNGGEASPDLSYRIIGHSATWQALGQQRRLYLKSLPPGTFTLELRAHRSTGAPARTARVILHSTHPYYETWWFRLGVLAGVAGLGGALSYLLYRKRLREERRRYERERLVTQERERIARELHDDLGTDLSEILYLSDTGGEPLSADEQSEVVSLSQGALRRMREIVHRIYGSPHLLRDVWAEVVSRTQEAARRTGNASCQVDALDPDLTLLEVSDQERREMQLFVKEAVSNALHHGAASTVWLSLKPVPTDGLELSVRDNGQGFTEGLVVPGMGLQNLRVRAAALGGSVSITSQPGSGTAVVLRWPHRPVADD